MTSQAASVSDAEKLRVVVAAHGGQPASVRAFDEDVADLLPYTTLRERRQARPDQLGAAVGVYEWQEAPLLVLVDGDRLRGPDHLALIRRMVALRGDIPYLGVAAGGRLDVYVVGLDGERVRPVDFDEAAVTQVGIIPYISAVRPDLDPNAATVSEVVLDLLEAALKTLTGCGLAQADAISLAGRALFARFLADRDLSLGSHLGIEDVDQAFATPGMARLTCLELERNFNGNLLPLDLAILDRLPDQAFEVLIDIMRRAPGGQMSLGWRERWDDLHFAHIPVGILSQAYERYLRNHQPDDQIKYGSYYTPTAIAELMVRATIHGIPDDARHAARYLDPAVGAGVFLITAFRHLVAERWRYDGKRPCTRVLREILYDQIAGFDVDEAALRFAALGLYLVSIELDPDPEPISKLAFADLRGTVLHRPIADATMGEGKKVVSLAALGSLGPGVPTYHEGRYDVVIGNPPWKTGVKVVGWQWVENKVRAIAAGRLPSPSKVTIESPVTPDPSRAPSLLPNNAPDLPFVWRAAEWARPGGQLAFALHGRLLFQQSEGMPQARAKLFGAFDVTSVINGAALRKTKVWPQITTPFCILFARNRPAGPAAAMRFVTPREEPRLNRTGIFRLDAANAPVVRLRDISEDPLRLKTLFRGSELDLEIRARIVEACHPRLLDLVSAAGGVSGSGIQKLRPSSRIRRGQTLPGADAGYLRGMPYLSAGVPTPFIDTGSLAPFDMDRIHDPRDIAIFRAPLLIVDKVARSSARATARGFASGLAVEDTAFSVNYYGYGLPGKRDGLGLGLHLAAILRSSYARWWFLITSGEYGFEREVVEKHAFDAIPIPAPESSVSPEDPEPLRDWYARHAESLDGDVALRDELDDRVAGAFGLTDADARVIRDTLSYAFDDPPGATDDAGKLDLSDFLDGLGTGLSPWERDFGADLAAVPQNPQSSRTWYFVTIGRSATEGVDDEHARAGFLRAADESGSTEVYHRARDGRLWIAMLARPRYWTFSQGLRCARHVAWNHIEFLMDHGEGRA